MVERAVAVNPAILVWARTRAGLSVAEAAERASRAPADIQAWEAGKAVPTFRQLEVLAERVYKRPIALFFFPKPPVERDPASEFRTLPEAEFEKLDADTRYAIRQGYGWQESLKELTGGRNPAARLITRDIEVGPRETPEALAARVRGQLGVDVSDQKRWHGQTEAFKEWRAHIEAAGIFVFKRSFQQSGVSGFCLDDPEFPIIVINNGTSYSRQAFTLFHELAHLLFDVSGITKRDDQYIDHLRGADRRIEITCNAFASEFLLPEANFPWQLVKAASSTVEAATKIAGIFNVSRELVLRRLLDEGFVSQATYTKLSRQWNEEFVASRAKGSGGNYYATQAAYLGQGFLDLAFGLFRAGRITRPELAEHLGVKARNLDRLEEYRLAGR